MTINSIPESEMLAFDALLSEHQLDRSQFTLKVTEHPAATFGPRVRTIKVSWKDMLEADYSASESTSWVEQFRADWDSGLIPGIVADTRASHNAATNSVA